MAAVSEVHHVCLSVRNLQASLRFYADGLGLRPTLRMDVGQEGTWEMLRLPRGTMGRSVFLQGPSKIGQVELVEWDLPVPAASRPKEPGDPGILLLSFAVEQDEIAELHERLGSMGVEIHAPPRTRVLDNYGPISIFVCRDPDGNMVEILSLPSDEVVRAFRAARSSADGE